MAGVPAGVIWRISVAGFVDDSDEKQVPGAEEKKLNYSLFYGMMKSYDRESSSYNGKIAILY